MHKELSVIILQPDLQGIPIIGSCHVYLAFPHKLRPEGKPLRAVMIAADHEYFFLLIRQAGEKPVKHLHCLCGGRLPVVNVPGNQNPLRMAFLCNLQNLPENIFLILDHGKLIDPLADM